MIRKGRLGLRTYPYVNARVRAMKRRLITKGDYYKLMKMNINEITKFLEESEYKKEIDELAADYSGIDLAEMAISLNLKRVSRKLLKLSDREVQILISAYLRRWDVWNFKTVLRGKASGAKEEKIKNLLIAGGEFRYHFFVELLKKDSVGEIIESVPSLRNCPGMKEGVEEFGKTNSLMKIENALDRQYYGNLLIIANKIPKQGGLCKAFIKTELDILNLRNILRLKRERFKKEQILENLICYGARLNRARLEQLAASETLDALLNNLEGNFYGDIIKKGTENLREHNELSTIEIALNKYWLSYAFLLLHQHPLSICPIIGYLIAKEIEVKNLRMLARAKQSGLDERFVEDNLII